MKQTAAKGRSAKKRTVKQRTVRRTPRVQRGRVTLASTGTVASNFARWTIAQPWDGQHHGSGLVDTSQLACECGECWSCQQRIG